MFPLSNNRINLLMKTSSSMTQEIYVKAYKGLVGKIMQLTGYAISANKNFFINKKSLAKHTVTHQGFTNQINDKAIEILLAQPSLLQKARLSELLSEPELDLLWSNKDKLPSEKTLYNYINGITDIDGNIQDLAVSRDNLEYIESLRGMINESSPVKVTLQTAGFEKEISSTKSELSKMILPLDDYLKDSEANSKFQQLPKEHQEYIFASARENYAGISPEEQRALMAKEHELKQVLPKDQLSEFKRCMKHANTQNAARSGFIHFRSQDAVKTTPFERIYIQMNKEHAEDLVRLLISELHKQGEYPGVLDIKVAGQQVAGRTDGIVIYIGEASQKREKAIKERDKILGKLKEMQQQRPELFGNHAMPFKEVYTPGVAIIPELSTSESFTENLSRAIASALATSTDRQGFRSKIIDAFFST